MLFSGITVLYRSTVALKIPFFKNALSRAMEIADVMLWPFQSLTGRS